MLCKTHIIYIGLLRAGIRQHHRIVPEPEAVNSRIALCHREEGLSIVSLHSGNHIVFPVQPDGSRIHHRIDPQPLHKIRIGLFVNVIFPDHRNVLSRQDRILIPVQNSVVEPALPIALLLQGFQLGLQYIILSVYHLILPESGSCARCDTGISTAQRLAFGSPAFRSGRHPRTIPSPLFCQ